MKRITIVLLLCTFWAKAQKLKGFEFVKVDSTFAVPTDLLSAFPPEVKLGGISGIEFFNNAHFMVSDRAFKSETNQNSYIFKMDTVGKVSAVFKFFGVDNAESIRFDNLSQNMFYAFEREDSTGIGYINEYNVPTNFATFSMTTDSLTSDNRGIESLGFDGNKNLWFAFESSINGGISFFQCPFDIEKKNYDYSKKKIYNYPFDARNCLKTEQQLNGNLGNGVTEILPIVNNKLLVMERCFDGAFITMKLFVASIPTEGNLISKELVFEFTKQNEFLGTNHALKPDNMEGMTWGNEEDGHRILYVISDDNFNPKRQRTLLLKLRELK